jgi:hypothetical protein
VGHPLTEVEAESSLPDLTVAPGTGPERAPDSGRGWHDGD